MDRGTEKTARPWQPLTERERELLRLLESCLSRLRQEMEVDPGAVEPLGAEHAAVQRWLQVAVQSCLDLADSLLGRMGESVPPRGRDLFLALVRTGLLDAVMAGKMARLTEHH